MISPLRSGLLGAIGLIVLSGLSWSRVDNAEDEYGPDPEDLVPGLVSEFWPLDGDSPRVTRQTPTLVSRWDRSAPDLRLPPGGFRGRWSGWVLIRDEGKYRFRIDSDGPYRLRVGDEVIRGEGGHPELSDGAPLERGLARIELTSEHPGDDRRIIVDWEGPTFPFEHIPASVLFHEADRSTNIDPFERGRRLADRLGCANCHHVSGVLPRPSLGPPLDGEASIHRDWLIDWIVNPSKQRHGTSMPGFRLEASQAGDVVSFLESVSRAPTEPDRETRMAMNVADPGRGRLLFRSLGCLGCHEDEDSGVRHSITDARVSLAGLGAKRSLDSVARVLRGASRDDPGRHRPEFDLTPEAAAHLAAYLTRLEPGPTQPSRESPMPGDPDRGRELITSVGCASCHRIPGVNFDRAPIAISLDGIDDEGCLSETPRGGVPNYGLNDDERMALRSFLSALPSDSAELPGWTRAQDAIRRHNCLGCHARYGEGGHGIASQLPKLLGEDRELNGFKGTLTPPDLSSVGAKLREGYLARAIKGDAPRARPWLSVQMPRFHFEPGEAEVIASYFLQMDRVDQIQDVEPPATLPETEVEVGALLLGRRGFGCVSCHVIDGKIPPGGEAETLGPDLALAHQRMTRSYFDRWLNDPQRILPGTAMPQFLIPVPGVEGSVAEQLGMVWDVLGSPELSTMTSTATRQFLTRQGDRALVVRDMVVLEDDPVTYVPRGIAIGLTGDRSLLFDADRLSWTRWWDQGFLYRSKQGRLWEWHPEGRVLWKNDDALPPVLFATRDGALVLPEEERSRFGSFVELQFVEDRVQLEYALSLPMGGTTRVVERLAPTEVGWSRRVEMSNLPDHLTPRIVVATGTTWDERGVALLPIAGSAGVFRVGATGTPIEAPAEQGQEELLLLQPGKDPDGTYRGEVILSIQPKIEDDRVDR